MIIQPDSAHEQDPQFAVTPSMAGADLEDTELLAELLKKGLKPHETRSIDNVLRATWYGKLDEAHRLKTLRPQVEDVMQNVIRKTRPIREIKVEPQSDADERSRREICVERDIKKIPAHVYQIRAEKNGTTEDEERKKQLNAVRKIHGLEEI